MSLNRKWILFNALTGDIIKNQDGSDHVLPAIDDECRIDINNGDDATLTIAAYGLDFDYRINYGTVFKNWARGIALINDDVEWNHPQKILFAGIILKKRFSTRSEEIQITAYSVFEWLKRLPIVPAFSGITSESDVTIEASTWEGLYTKLIQSATSVSGAPTGYKIYNTLSLPAASGTGVSYVTKNTERELVADAMIRIRDEISANGQEFRFVPQYTSSDMTKLGFNMMVGTQAQPHINSAIMSVNLFEDTSVPWSIEDYDIEDDATLVYNRYSVTASNPKMVSAYDSSDPDMPALYYNTDANVNMTDDQINAQIAARSNRGMITDKTPSIQIKDDEVLEWKGFLGRTVSFVSGDKSAGSGTTLRIVGITFRSSDATVELDALRPASRYPKLPKDSENPLDYDGQDPGFGGGDVGGDYDGGGWEFPLDFGDSKDMIYNRILSGFVDCENVSNIYHGDTDDYFYQVLYSPTNTQLRRVAINYAAGPGVGEPIVSLSQITEPIQTIIDGLSDIATPANVTFSNSYVANKQRTRDYFYPWVVGDRLYILVTRVSVYGDSFSTIDPGSYRYRNNARRYKQGIIVFDLYPDNGLADFDTEIDVKFAIPQYATSAYDTFHFHPDLNAVHYNQGSGNAGQNWPANNQYWRSQPPIVMDDDTVVFPNITVLIDEQQRTGDTGNGNKALDWSIHDSSVPTIEKFTIYDGPFGFETQINQATPLMSGRHENIVADFSSPYLPTFKRNDLFNEGQVPLVYAPRGNYPIGIGSPGSNSMATGELAVVDIYPNGGQPITTQQEVRIPKVGWHVRTFMHRLYTHDVINQRIFLQLLFLRDMDQLYHGTDVWFEDNGRKWLNPFPADPETITENYHGQLFVLNYGKGEKTWRKAGSNYKDVAAITAPGINNQIHKVVTSGDDVFIPLDLTDGKRQNLYSPFAQISDFDMFRTQGQGYVNVSTFQRTGVGFEMTNSMPAIQLKDGLWLYNSAQQRSGSNGTTPLDTTGYSHTVSVQPSPYRVNPMRGRGHSVCMRDGTIWIYRMTDWGGPRYLDVKALQPLALPVESGEKVLFTHAVSVPNALFAIDRDGQLWGYGSNTSHFASPVASMTKIAAVSSVRFVDVQIEHTHGAALDDEGNIWVWGDNSGYQTGLNLPSGVSTIQKLNIPKKFLKIAVGYRTTGGIAEDRKFWYAGTMSSAGAGEVLGTRQVMTQQGTRDYVDLAMSVQNVILLGFDNKIYSGGYNTIALGVGAGSATSSIGLGERTIPGGVLPKKVFSSIATTTATPRSTMTGFLADDGRVFTAGNAETTGRGTGTYNTYGVAFAGAMAGIGGSAEDVMFLGTVYGSNASNNDATIALLNSSDELFTIPWGPIQITTPTNTTSSIVLFKVAGPD